jgi:hypothetical protein
MSSLYAYKSNARLLQGNKTRQFSLPCLLIGSKHHLHNSESSCVIPLPYTCYAKFVANGLLQKQMQRKSEARMYMPSQQKRNIKTNKEYSNKCGKIQIINHRESNPRPYTW